MISFPTATLSASDAEYLSNICIALAIISGIILVLGLIGEFPESSRWKKSVLYKLAKLAVIFGVSGELLGDAGIFMTSIRLQQITDNSIIDNIKVQKAMIRQLQPRGQYTRDEFHLLTSLFHKDRRILSGITVYLIPDPEAYTFGLTLLEALTSAHVNYKWAILKSNIVDIPNIGIPSTGITIVSVPHSGICATFGSISKIDRGFEFLSCTFPESPPSYLPIPSLFIMLKPPPFEIFPEYTLPAGTKLPAPAWEPK
jgi:hypothetical protein